MSRRRIKKKSEVNKADSTDEVQIEGVAVERDKLINLAAATLVITFADIYDPVIESSKCGCAVDCHKGCSACCDTLVGITLLEGVALALYSEHMGVGIPRCLPDHLQKLSNVGCDKEKWYDQRIPCMFLKDNLCSVYTARPFVCRNYMVKKGYGQYCGDRTGEKWVQFLVNPALMSMYVQGAMEVHSNIGLPGGLFPLPLAVELGWTLYRDGYRAFRDAFKAYGWDPDAKVVAVTGFHPEYTTYIGDI